MTRYVALLRGINVGGRSILPMAELRASLAALGLTDVRTLLQSGNAVFTAADRDTAGLAAEIETRLEADTGRPIRVMVRTAGEMRAVVEGNPLDVREPAKMMVVFLDGPADAAALDGIDRALYEPEELAVGGRELYLYLPDGAGRARLPVLLERADRRTAKTTRNWNTTTRLLDLAEG